MTLEAPATPEDPQGMQRLRRWLKQSWRGYALKCTRITLADSENQTPNERPATAASSTN